MNTLQSHPSHTRIGGSRDIILHQPKQTTTPRDGLNLHQTHSVDHRSTTTPSYIRNSSHGFRQGVDVDKVLSTKPPHEELQQHHHQSHIEPTTRTTTSTSTKTNVVTKTKRRRRKSQPLMFSQCCMKSRSNANIKTTSTTTKSYTRSRSRSQSTSSSNGEEGGWCLNNGDDEW